MLIDLEFAEQARRELNELKNVVIVARLHKLFERLKNWPNVSGVKALSGNLAGKYRIRTGDYRVQFRVENVQPVEAPKSGTGSQSKQDETAKKLAIVIEKVGHRDGFYDY